MTPIVLAATAALVWGTSDFCGGKGAQRANALAVTVVSHLAGLPLLAGGLLLISGTPRAADLGWGALGGVAGLVGIALLYHGLSGGAMAVVSPVTAVTAAVVPLAAGLLLDGALSGFGLAGVACAVVAIALVSLNHGGRVAVARASVGLALLAGTMFGVFFILLAQVHPDSGLWALVGVRLGSLPLGWLVAVRAGVTLRLPGRALVWAALAGGLDLTANWLFLLAVMQGHLSVVAVLASLYPASTVMLALTVDKERLRPVQIAGLGLAATALVLTAS